MSDGIARAFNRSGTARAAALDIFKAFDRVWHPSLLHKRKSYGISGQIFGLVSYFSVLGSFGFFWMGNCHKNIQLMLEFLKGPFLMLSVVLLSMLMILLYTLNVIRHLILVKN